eukprot:CAMPEP_0184527094 /NCGR_PEP_ID=MMETSP0198_2-20121128/11012_1 /TAXON_ID=1112570 /ORGANISM="Thraustochytrium sp., Strain LLF1b" /LENGTH=136 /DNA_ID=CAMNT_0026918725 /DNA_START=98 /DNA_END=508 /DNA_ORIENTATION=-
MLALTTFLVHEYDPAIEFFVDVLGFELSEDSASTASDGSAKRWVVVRPKGKETGFLIAKAKGDEQKAVVGKQHGGRVGFFLHVEDFDVQYTRMKDHGVEFLEEPRHEPYGTVVVFRDIAGNLWDLLGPSKSSSASN